MDSQTEIDQITEEINEILEVEFEAAMEEEAIAVRLRLNAMTQPDISVSTDW